MVIRNSAPESAVPGGLPLRGHMGLCVHGLQSNRVMGM